MYQLIHKLLCAIGDHRYGPREIDGHVPVLPPNSSELAEWLYTQELMQTETVATCIHCGKQIRKLLITEKGTSKLGLVNMIRKIQNIRSKP